MQRQRGYTLIEPLDGFWQVATRRAMKCCAFTLLEVVVVVIVICIAAVLAMTGIRSARINTRLSQNATHLLGIHRGLILFSPGNKDWYPGMHHSGGVETKPLPPREGVYGTGSASGYEPAYRMTLLLRGNYFSPEYAISPGEPAGGKVHAQPNQNVTTAHFSYAMLRIDEPDGRRRAEWKSTMDSKSAVLSDRNLASAGAPAVSIHAPNDPWLGNVTYQDNHVELHRSNIIPTARSYQRFDPEARIMVIPGRVDADDLFADDADDHGQSGNDAAMVHQDAVTYVNQK